MKRLLNKLNLLGDPLRSTTSQSQPHPNHDISQADLCLIESVDHYTMTGLERRYHLIQSIRYILKNNIAGSIVECGVWRGGSMMLAAKVLLESKASERDLFLFDTFEGMPPPQAIDTHPTGATAADLLDNEKSQRETSYIWAIATKADVQSNLQSTRYPADRMHFIQGTVETTIPSAAPQQIALLRLDTDWYESTRHELNHLYSRVSRGGVVIIDDYGWWNGSRAATDEFIAQCPDPILLHRLDSGGGYSFVKVA